MGAEIASSKTWFFALRLTDCRMVTIFGASCRYQFWGFVLDRLGGFKIQMSLTEDFVVSCLPVCDLSGFETMGFVKREFRVSENASFETQSELRGAKRIAYAASCESNAA